MSNALVEGVNIVPAFAAAIADIDTDQTGDYVCLKNYGKVGVLAVFAAGTAIDDPNLLLYEATDNAGTGAALLTDIDTYWIKQAATTLAAVTTFTKTAQTLASSIGLNATSAEQVEVVYFEVRSDHLSAGFDYIRVDTTQDASTGAQYACVLYLMLDPRYPQATALDAVS